MEAVADAQALAAPAAASGEPKAATGSSGSFESSFAAWFEPGGRWQCPASACQWLCPAPRGWWQCPVPNSQAEICFSIASTPAYIVNLPEDEGRRKATRREVNALQPLQCVVPRGVCGANLVSRAEREKVGTCRLHLTRDASATLGVTSALQKSKQPAQAINAFGCALSHRAVLIAAARLEFPSDFAWVFEDDAYCPIVPESINTTLEGLLCAALEAGHAVDIVYCGQTGAVSTGAVLACDGGCAPRRCRCRGHRLVRTKRSYGSFSYLVRRSKIASVCEFLDPAVLVYTSDGALRQSCANGLEAAHFEEAGARCNLIAHRPPSETGGSRIKPS